MKKSLLYSSFIALALLFGATVFFSNQGEEYYQPRNGSDEQGISGAMEWLNSLRADPATGEVSYQQMLEAREKVRMADSRLMQKKSAQGLNWQVVGPDNVGGRTRAFLIDEDNPQIMFSGSVTGGLFKSVNGGGSWYPVSDPQSNLGVVCITKAPDGTIYYGTGEDMYNGAYGNGSASSPGFVGGGIYKSTDGGETFNVIETTVPSSLSPNVEWAAVGKIAVDPNNSDRIYAATNKGLRITTDGGQIWTNPISGMIGGTSAAEDMFVTESGKVWVKTGSVIYFSPTGDAPYVEKTNIGPLSRNSGRMRIAVSPEDDNYVYVVSINPSNRSFDRAFQSKDEGNSWRVIGEQTPLLNPHANQGNYNNALRVSPYDKERILVGGLDVYEWSEANGWQQLSFWAASAGFPYYVHADNHDFVFHPTQRNTFYIVNDGGIFRSQDDGQTFTELNNNYITLQFYNIGLGPEGSVLGGTQDNGTWFIDPQNQSIKTRGIKVLGGDGGYTQASKLHPGVAFVETQRGNARRAIATGNDVSLDNYFDLQRMGGQGVFGTEDWAGWIMPYVLWEKLDDPHSQKFIRFGADSLRTNLGFGTGARTFIGSFTKPQDATIIVPDGARVSAGSRVLETDANGIFRNSMGDSVGFINPQTGGFEISFDDPVVQEVIAEVAVRYDNGAVIHLESAINDLPIVDTLFNGLAPNQSKMIVDPVQAAFFVGLKSRHRGPGLNNHGGIWMTREILSNLSGIPEWWHIGDLTNGEVPISMATSDDGDILFVGTSSGRLYRFSNLINARDSASADINDLFSGVTLVRENTSVVEKTLVGGIGGGGRVITSIAVHPFDKNKMLVTAGNYGNTHYVYYSDNAAGPSPSVQSVQGDMPEMPAYASTFNYTATGSDPEVLIGTEFGVYSTEDIEAASVEWTHEINGFANVPVFTLVQERTIRYDLKQPLQDFEGAIYAGTYGRGIFKTTSTVRYVGIDENEIEEKEAESRRVLNIYPNPAVDVVTIDLALGSRSDVEIHVHDMNGKMVKSAKFTKLPKETESVELRMGSLPKGAYIVRMLHEGTVTSGKVIKD